MAEISPYSVQMGLAPASLIIPTHKVSIHNSSMHCRQIFPRRIESRIQILGTPPLRETPVFPTLKCHPARKKKKKKKKKEKKLLWRRSFKKGKKMGRYPQLILGKTPKQKKKKKKRKNRKIKKGKNGIIFDGIWALHASVTFYFCFGCIFIPFNRRIKCENYGRFGYRMLDFCVSLCTLLLPRRMKNQ